MCYKLGLHLCPKFLTPCENIIISNCNDENVTNMSYVSVNKILRTCNKLSNYEDKK